jgi:hypothetical protein
MLQNLEKRLGTFHIKRKRLDKHINDDEFTRAIALYKRSFASRYVWCRTPLTLSLMRQLKQTYKVQKLIAISGADCKIGAEMLRAFLTATIINLPPFPIARYTMARWVTVEMSSKLGYRNKVT